MEDMNAQLASQRTQFSTELFNIEEELKSLRTRGDELRRKIAAIDILIGAPGNGFDDEPEGAEDERELNGLFTPVEAYWRPILEVLVRMGGRGRRRTVIDAVGKQMANVLTKADYEGLPKSGYPRWRNRIQWQASNMRRRGFIKRDSPRGVWEISDEGRRWLDDGNA